MLSCPIYNLHSDYVQSDDGVSLTIPPSFTAQEPTFKIWHNDCSNTSGFQYEEMSRSFARNLVTTDVWVNTEGVFESDGQSLYLMNITEPSPVEWPFYYGPTAIYDLSDTFPVSGLRNFSAQIELVNSNPEDCGIAAVALFDENLSPVLIASCEDDYSSATGFLFWHYYPRNYTVLYTYFDKEPYDYWLASYEKTLDFVNATWSASYMQSQGIWGDIPSYETPNGSIVAENDVEHERAIKYLGLAIGGYYKDGYRTTPQFRIHDIYLEYEVGGDIDTIPPLMTPQLDRVYIVGQTGNTITWNCTDDHPYRFWLFERFQDLPLEEGLWNGSSISMSIDGLELGDYGFKLYIQDKAGFIVGDYVKVSVIEDPIMNAFFSFVSANALFILVISIVALGCVLNLRSRREAARLHGDAWSRSLKKQTNNDSQLTDLFYE